MTAQEISEKLRLVFSVIQEAVSNRESPLIALENYRNQESLRSSGQTIVSQVRSIAGKTFETAVEALVKAAIEK